jgi:hypothetical protein
VLHDSQTQRWQVEHLAGLDPDHARPGQVRAAAAAPAGGVQGDLVGLGDLGQVGARGAGLLAGPAMRCPLVGAAFGPRGLAQPVRGWRLGGVGGVLAEPALQLGHPSLERGNQAGLPGVGRAQLGDDHGLHRDGGFQLGVGGRDRGLQTSSGQARLPWAVPNSYPTGPQTVNSFTARGRRNEDDVRVPAACGEKSRMFAAPLGQPMAQRGCNVVGV